ncbi:hypothetical protein PoB_005835700 [Plakobranchus ocellatus]|uniref:Transposase n=1 Tax=Plakobranchus ocellatus TaxID=259542 RepID=A0AAV4CJZ4_9GAST|nr:hypothetical protein PoB_005835700 [Plakobranchus ocellatus]
MNSHRQKSGPFQAYFRNQLSHEKQARAERCAKDWQDPSDGVITTRIRAGVSHIRGQVSAATRFIKDIKGWLVTKPVHNMVISGFQALRQARAQWQGSNPLQKGLRAYLLTTVPTTPPNRR